MKYSLFVWALFYSSISWSQHKSIDPPQFKMFPEILVKPLQGVMRISRDTIEFKVADELNPTIVNVEDLFKKYQGFYVTDEGKIFYNGTEVSVLMIDGDPISVFDYRHVASNLRASMINSIEVIRHYTANRMESNYWANDGLAVNLKMKKEYVNKISTDILFALSSRKGLLGKIDLVRMGSMHKSITLIEKNIRQKLIHLEENQLSNESAAGIYFLKGHHLPLFQTNFSLRRDYLPTNTTLKARTVHTFSFGQYHKMHVDIGVNRFSENTRFSQEATMKLTDHFIWHQRHVSNLSNSGTQQTLNLFYIHDRFKNNRGEYKLLLNNYQYDQILCDSVFMERWRVNKGNENSRNFSFLMMGQEQLALKNKYLVEVKWNLAENRICRNTITTNSGFSDFNVVQQFISTDVNLSRALKKAIYRTGVRYFYEKRESIVALLKQYLYTEYQYRLSKKVQLQQDLAFGRGSYSQQFHQEKKPIYQINGKLVYDKALFNQYTLGFFLAQKIPVIDVPITKPLVDIYGTILYTDLTHLFQQIKRIEFGRNRNDLYKGFQYAYQITYSQVENDVHHSLGLQQFMMIDTLRFTGNSNNIQFNTNVDQLIFPIHLRGSLLYQRSVSYFQQSINGQLHNLYLQSSLLKLGVKSTGNHFIQYEIYSSLQRTSSLSSTIHSKNLQLLIKYKCDKNLFIGFQSYRYKISKQHLYYFMDLFITTSVYPKLKINIACINMLNIKNYQQQYVGTNGLQTTTTKLGGRTIQAEIKWAL